MLDPGQLPDDDGSAPEPRKLPAVAKTLRKPATPENRKKHLTRMMGQFGYGPEKYDEMLREQRGVCALCGQPPDHGEPLVIDHDHNPAPGSKRLRGLIHDRCNTGLGKFLDQPELLEMAAEYLRRYRRLNAQ
jgi:recombination endonuclease VII